MKKLLLLLVASITLIVSGCGVYSVSSGMADEAAVCFVDAKKYSITVDIDGKTFQTETISQRPNKAHRSTQKASSNHIKVAPGRHNVKVIKDGKEI